jgi:hypothetical protein
LLKIYLVLAALALSTPSAHARAEQAQPHQNSAASEASAPPPSAISAVEPPFPANEQASNSQNTAAPKPPLSIGDHVRRWAFRFLRDPIAVFTLALFIIGGLQFSLSNDVSRRQLRAYIIVTPNFMVAFDDKAPARFRALLRNDGLTPAFRVTHKLAIALIPFPIPAEVYLPEPPGLDKTEFVIFPRDSITAEYANVYSFTPAEIADIKAARVAIAVFGTVFYEDIFKKKHWTRFGAYVNADAPTLQKLASAYEPSDLKLSFSILPSASDADR